MKPGLNMKYFSRNALPNGGGLAVSIDSAMALQDTIYGLWEKKGLHAAIDV